MSSLTRRIMLWGVSLRFSRERSVMPNDREGKNAGACPARRDFRFAPTQTAEGIHARNQGTAPGQTTDADHRSPDTGKSRPGHRAGKTRIAAHSDRPRPFPGLRNDSPSAARNSRKLSRPPETARRAAEKKISPPPVFPPVRT